MAFGVPNFDLTTTAIDERTEVVTVRGEIHVSTAQEFAQRLEEAIARGAPALVLDLTGVEFIDSTGLSVLLNGQRSVTLRGGRLALAVSNPTVLRLFEITRLDSTFELRGTREEALDAVRE
jgi:anti-sigma B factor antagonist